MLSYTLISAATLAASVIAQSTTSAANVADAQTTINAPVITGLVGSIQDADACGTTVIIVRCAETESPNEVCETLTDFEGTLTLEPTAYNFAFATDIAGATGLVNEGCDLEGPSGSPTLGHCTASYSLSAGDFSTESSTSVEQTSFEYAPVPITAGASKLPTGSAACSPTSDGGAAPTGISKVYKVIVPVVVAAGAGALL